MYSKFSKRLYVLNSSISKIEEVFMVIGMIVLSIVMIWQVMCRYLLNIPTPWSEELLRYTFIALTFIGSGYAIFKEEHIEINIINTFINMVFKDKNTNRRIFIVIRNIVFVLIIVLLVYYIQIYSDYVIIIKDKGQLSASMQIPMWIPMSSGVLGMALMIFHGVSGLIIPDKIWKDGEK